MYVLIKIDGTTEPTLRVKLLGNHETLEETRESMLADVATEVDKLKANGVFPMVEGEDYMRKVYHMGAHIFCHSCFWQWIIFDEDRPLAWNSLLSW